ncbi:PolC-type DNA polymerase III [Cohnella yongneupensis]|uniref:PolC-type DNA polymerase III n=1 Tax=Cohnella yongneupensis TaxID=425006 RepID=A0ABW0QZQ4_9BACL
MILNDICVFDFETSGLDHQNDRVIELAAIRVRNGEIVGQFQTLIHQPIELPEKITEITGITPELMRSGMDEDLAFKILRVLMRDALLVAHNAEFDLQFLHWTMMRLAGKTFTNSFIDTMTISRERHPFPHRLEPMCERYGIKLEGAHRAFNDVIGCFELLKAFHAEKPVDEWVNRLGFLSKYPPPLWVPDYAVTFPTENRYERREAI